MRTCTVLGENFQGRNIIIEKCTRCLQSIFLKIINFFETFVSFHLFRTWNMKFLDLWQQSFHPGCQNGFLAVYMSSLRDVGIRSDLTWRETFFEPWLKNFDLFLKTAFCVSKGTFWVKIFFWKFCFFNTFRPLKKKLLGLWWKRFRQGYQNWKLQSSSQKINQRIKFLKLLFFFNFFWILNEQLLCLAKKFSAGISKLKVAVIVSKDQSKIQIFESSLLFQNLQNFERTFTVLGVKF